MRGFCCSRPAVSTRDYYIDDGGVAHNTYYQYASTRPQHYAGGDASYFAGVHELKFGGGWRRTPVQTQQTWPGNHFVSNWNTYPNMVVQVARDYQSNTIAPLHQWLRHRHDLAAAPDHHRRRADRSPVLVARVRRRCRPSPDSRRCCRR